MFEYALGFKRALLFTIIVITIILVVITLINLIISSIVKLHEKRKLTCMLENSIKQYNEATETLINSFQNKDLVQKNMFSEINNFKISITIILTQKYGLNNSDIKYILKGCFLCDLCYLQYYNSTYKSIIDINEFEHNNSKPEHIDFGEKLFSKVFNNKIINNVLLYHHNSFEDENNPSPIEAQIYRLANLYIYELLNNKNTIIEATNKIIAESNKLFDPILIDIFDQEKDNIARVAIKNLKKIEGLKNEK